MKKLVVKNGLIGGVIVSALMIIGMLLFDENNPDYTIAAILGFSGIFIAFSLIFVAIRSYKKTQEKLTFWKAFQIGLYISLIASTMYVGTWMIYASGGTGDKFIKNYYEFEVKTMVENGATEKEIEAKQLEMDEMVVEYSKPHMRILYTYREILPIGILFSIIAALIYRTRKKKETPSS